MDTEHLLKPVNILRRCIFCCISYKVGFKKMRSLSKSLMPSAVDKKSLTMPDNPLMMVSGDGRQTLAFSPLLYRISPLCLRDDKASLTDGLPTPKNAISSRSEGRYSPSLISSWRIILSSSSATISESFFCNNGLSGRC